MLRSFDTVGACHFINIPHELIKRLSTATQALLDQAADPKRRSQLESTLELFTKLDQEVAGNNWVVIAPVTLSGNKQIQPEDSEMKDQVKIGNTILRLVDGDIADQDTDAVVTAAHYRLDKGTGTDGSIHTKGGPKIYEECERIGGCPIGDAVITTGGDLKARYVIHAVGPVWRGGDEREPELLASAYRRSLEVAAEHGLRSISLPSISTGAFVFPVSLAAPIALNTIIQFLKEGKHNLEEVRVVLYTRIDESIYREFEKVLESIMLLRNTS